MKKFALILIAVLALGLLVGCSGASSSGGSSDSGTAPAGDTIDLSALKTLGDAFALEGQDEFGTQRAAYEGNYIYAFTIDGNTYRVTADLPQDIFDEILNMDFDENSEAKEMALVENLEIRTAENLNEQILPQEELDALVGKTGQELFDAGWIEGSFYNAETLEVSLDYGPFAYLFHFDGQVPPEKYESFSPMEDLADMKVLDVTFEGVGDATNI